MLAPTPGPPPRGGRAQEALSERQADIPPYSAGGGESTGPHDALILAVAHRDFIDMGAAAIAGARGFCATTDFSRARDWDALILCVPTPLNQYREPDLSDVLATTDAIAPHLCPGQIVSLESTTWPRTTEEELQPRLKRQGLTVGQDVSRTCATLASGSWSKSPTKK